MLFSVSVFIDADYSGFTNQIVKEQREQARLQLALRAEPILPATGVNNIQTSPEVNAHEQLFCRLPELGL